MLQSKYTLIFALLLLSLFQLTTPKGPPEYLSFVDIRWKEIQNASLEESSFVAQPSKYAGKTALGVSDTVKFAGPLLRLEHSGRMPKGALPPIIRLTDVSGAQLLEFRPPLQDLPSRSWRAFEVQLPDEIVGRELRLAIKVKSNVDVHSWYSLRGRVDVFDKPDRFRVLGASGIWGLSDNQQSKLYGYTERDRIVNLLCFGFAAIGLFLVGSSLLCRRISNLDLLLTFIVVSVLFHYRHSVFFYWDEWDILWHLKEDLRSGIIRTHNEHFIPLFFSLYYLESLLFGDNYYLYLSVSYLLHAVNCLTLCLLLSALGRDTDFARRAAQLVGFCFLVSGLHPENLHWVVQQVDLLAEGSVLLALFATVRFMNKGRWKKLLQMGATVFAAPLFFGNGLVAAPKVVALAILSGLEGEQGADARVWWKRVIKVTIVAGLAGGAAVMLYLAHPPSSTPEPRTLLSWPDVKRMINYNITATHLGSFLRGLELFPYLDARAPGKLFGAASILGGEPDLGLGRVGLILSMFLLLLGLLLGGGWKYLRLWLLGEVIMLFSMLLPSFGRVKYGYFQGLSLRYTYSTLVGVAILVFAFLLAVHTWMERRNWRRGIVLSAFGYSYLLWLLAASVFVSREERFFTNIGYTNLVYAKQLLDWRNAVEGEDLSAKGTDLAGFGPTVPPDVVPGATHERIVQTLDWLSRGR